jgi:CBS domain-containing protein
MPQPRVRDVMTTDVITAPDDASVAEIAATLTGRRISAVPIVDRFDVVIGVVSWTDLHHTIETGEPDGTTDRGWLRRRRPPRLRWPTRAATDVLRAPPATIEPDASLSAAGRVMHQRQVGRLLVVDRAGRLMGIVTRGDLLKIHDRVDAVIRDEVVQRVLRRTLMIDPGAVQAAVDDGLVTLTGRTGRKSTTLATVGLTEAVAGVTGVVDRLAFDADDTAPPPAPRPPARDPLRGWRTGPRQDQPVIGGGAAAVDHDHGLPAYAAQATRSEAPR